MNLKYSPEIVQELIKYIEAGNYVTTACQAVGICRESYYQWLKDDDKIDITDEIIAKAEAKAIARNVLIIQNAAKESWQAGAWFLERKDYKGWGKKEQIGGIDGNPVNINLIPVRNKEDIENLDND